MNHPLTSNCDIKKRGGKEKTKNIGPSLSAKPEHLLNHPLEKVHFTLLEQKLERNQKKKANQSGGELDLKLLFT